MSTKYYNFKITMDVLNSNVIINIKVIDLQSDLKYFSHILFKSH